VRYRDTKVMNDIFSHDKYEIQFTVSIGVFYCMDETLEHMIKKSDDGLYFCKKNDRNQIRINKDK